MQRVFIILLINSLFCGSSAFAAEEHWWLGLVLKNARAVVSMPDGYFKLSGPLTRCVSDLTRSTPPIRHECNYFVEFTVENRSNNVYEQIKFRIHSPGPHIELPRQNVFSNPTIPVTLQSGKTRVFHLPFDISTEQREEEIVLFKADMSNRSVHGTYASDRTFFYRKATGEIRIRDIRPAPLPPPEPKPEPESPTGGINGSFFFDASRGNQPFDITVIFKGTFLSGPGTSGKKSFSTTKTKKISPTRIGTVSFTERGLAKGKWEISAFSNVTGSVTCQAFVPGFVKLNVIGGPSCN